MMGQYFELLLSVETTAESARFPARTFDEPKPEEQSEEEEEPFEDDDPPVVLPEDEDEPPVLLEEPPDDGVEPEDDELEPQLPGGETPSKRRMRSAGLSSLAPVASCCCRT